LLSLSPNFHIHVSVIYIFPWSVCLLFCRKICGLILGIYKSLKDTWMWKWGLRPCNSFSGNTSVGFLLLCIVLGKKLSRFPRFYIHLQSE
jgi:hypothetical protein